MSVILALGEAEARRLQVCGQHRLHSETVPKETDKKEVKNSSQPSVGKDEGMAVEEKEEEWQQVQGLQYT